MRIGYINEEVQRLCENRDVAAQRLPERVAGLLPLRLSQLAAFERLSEVARCGFLDLRILPDPGPWAGHYAIPLGEDYQVVFGLAGEYQRFLGGSVDLGSVTCIGIVAVETCSDGQI